MDWKNLQTMKCPACSSKIEDAGNMGYRCTGNCDFFISYEKFQRLITEMLMPKKPKYDPDKIDRSNWEI